MLKLKMPGQVFVVGEYEVSDCIIRQKLALIIQKESIDSDSCDLIQSHLRFTSLKGVRTQFPQNLSWVGLIFFCYSRGSANKVFHSSVLRSSVDAFQIAIQVAKLT